MGNVGLQGGWADWPEMPSEKLCREAREAVDAERDQLRQQVEKLLEEIDAHRLERSATSTPQRFSRDAALYSAADRVRKELGEGKSSG